MGVGYPGCSFFEEMTPKPSEEYLSSLKDNSTEDENKEFKEVILDKIKEGLRKEMDPYNEENWDDDKPKYLLEAIIDDQVFPVEFYIDNPAREVLRMGGFRIYPPTNASITFLDNQDQALNILNEYNSTDSVGRIKYKKIPQMEIRTLREDGLITRRDILYGINVLRSYDNSVDIMYDYYEIR